MRFRTFFFCLMVCETPYVRKSVVDWIWVHISYFHVLERKDVKKSTYLGWTPPALFPWTPLFPWSSRHINTWTYQRVNTCPHQHNTPTHHHSNRHQHNLIDASTIIITSTDQHTSTSVQSSTSTHSFNACIITKTHQVIVSTHQHSTHQHINAWIQSSTH